MSRWYDKRPRLGKRLDELKAMDSCAREFVFQDVIDLVKQNQPELLTFEKTSEFRFDSTRLRWYEHDPHLWLMFNVLELVRIDVLELVEDCLDNCAMSVA